AMIVPWRRARSAAPCAIEQKRTLACVFGERCGPLELRARLLVPPHLREEVASHTGKQVVIGKRRIVAKRVDDREPGGGAKRHGYGDRAVQLHDRATCDRGERGVQR